LNGRLQSVFDFFKDTLPQWYGSQEIRNSQVKIAVDIAGVLATDSKHKTILADAPVGTGKTFAVSIPALYDQNAGETSKRIIYATASLNLQAQLRNEELKI
jgi:ATP-dependent DNA helicase DinG